MKSLFDTVVGDTVFRYFADTTEAMPLKVTSVTDERILCGEWQFDKRTGAEIDEFLTWGPALTGSYILAVAFPVENK